MIWLQREALIHLRVVVWLPPDQIASLPHSLLIKPIPQLGAISINVVSRYLIARKPSKQMYFMVVLISVKPALLPRSSVTMRSTTPQNRPLITRFSGKNPHSPGRP